MFVRQHQNQFRTANADVQMFYGFGNQDPSTDRNYMTWNKPPGVSHVYMLLIGGGGNGNTTSGGGSGAVTVWYGAAQNVPDSLAVYVRTENPSAFNTTIAYRSSSGLISLLTANSADSPAGAPSSAATQFAASGFYNNTAGTAGNSVAITPSATTFLSAGGPSSITANYGYSIGSASRGFFQLQPIIVGVGSSTNSPDRAAIGCGGDSQSNNGGPGFALIASW